MNIWILGTSTLAPLARQLEKELAARGFEASVTVAGAGEFNSQLHDEASAYRTAAPETTILIPDTHDILRPTLESPVSRGPKHRSLDLTRALAQVQLAIQGAASTSAQVFVANGSYPPSNSLGLLESNTGLSVADAVAAYNTALNEAAATHENVYVVDYRGLVAKVGYDAFHDRRMWAHARMRLSGTGITALAGLLARALSARLRRPRKCVVVDLDNTLWGGVLGEVGPGGVAVGGEGVGVCYAELQYELLELRARGILLAIASKNDHDEAMSTIATHPGMVIRPEHLATTRIGWGDKADSLREIAAELKLSVDALAFIDDSAHECEAIRSVLPEVGVIELTADPADYVGQLRACEVFDTLSLTDTDRRRSELIRQEQARAASASDAPDMQTFLRDLKQQANVTALSQMNTPRAAQLCARTNQFNLTLRRHDQAALAKLRDGGALGLVLSVRDRLGDAGAVGFGLIKPEGDEPGQWQLDTLVMSCRVLGRGLEAVLLSELVRAAQAAGATSVSARYTPGPRNSQCARFLGDHGFAKTGDAHQLSCEDLPPAPDYIEITREPS